MRGKTGEKPARSRRCIGEARFRNGLCSARARKTFATTPEPEYLRCDLYFLSTSQRNFDGCDLCGLGFRPDYRSLFRLTERAFFFMDKNRGTLYGLSVGPGDPELMTLKAVKILKQCPVAAVPVTHRGNTLALDIARKIVDFSDKELLLLPFEMTRDKEKLRLNHEAQAARVAERLALGRDVAFLTLGDVSVFSTFSYVAGILKEKGYAVTMIPGVTSFCASACALGISLTEMQRPLHIIPAGFYSAREALALPGAKVLMKAGSQFPEVRRAVLESGREAFAAVDCGLESEALYETLEDMPEKPGYFTTVIVKEKP
jgi:precorrin-2/cobalt-factor-2 C20-methyltransferase